MVVARPSPAPSSGPRRAWTAPAPTRAWAAATGALLIVCGGAAQEPTGPLAVELASAPVPVSAAWAADWSLAQRGGLVPIAVDVHPGGVVAGLERRRHRLFLLNRAGEWLGLAGDGGGGDAGVGFAERVFARSGLKIFTLDSEQRTVDRFDLGGRWEARFDVGREADRAGAAISRAADFALDRAGELFVLDAVRGTILRFGPDGRFVASLETWGDWPPAEARALDVDGRGRLFLLGGRPAAVWVLEPSGRLIERRPVVAAGEAGEEAFEPAALAVDAWGNAFVGGRPGKVRVLPSGGAPPWWLPAPAERAWQVADLAVDGQHRLLVADPGQARIRVFTLEYRERAAARGPGSRP